jgi:hypothetical protein
MTDASTNHCKEFQDGNFLSASWQNFISHLNPFFQFILRQLPMSHSLRINYFRFELLPEPYKTDKTCSDQEHGGIFEHWERGGHL